MGKGGKKEDSKLSLISASTFLAHIFCPTEFTCSLLCIVYHKLKAFASSMTGVFQSRVHLGGGGGNYT